MRFTCPSCNSSYRLSRDRLGTSGMAKIKCPSCKTLVRVRVGDDGKLTAKVYQPSGAVAPMQVKAPAAKKAAPSPARATQPRTADPAPAGDGEPAIWHIAIDRKAEGPLPLSRIRELLTQGRINANSLAWRKGQDGWKKLREISALAKLLHEGDGKPQAAGEIKTTLKTGAAHMPADDEATVMQEIVTDEQLARTGSPQDGADDDATVMQDVVRLPGERSDNRLSRKTGGQRKTSGRSRRKGRKSGAATQAEEAAQARTLKPGRKQSSRSTGARLPNKSNVSNKPEAPKVKIGKPVKAATPAKAAKPEKANKTAANKTAAKKPLPSGEKPQAGNAAGAQAFFETGEMLNQDFELQMPDPNKHKPTKEEYQNLLQEFSVMFRLDKRSKRQKVMITVVLASLLIGVIAFGVVLYLQGEQRKSLLRDSKTILAVFALPYQNSADFDLTPEDEVAEGSAIRKKKTVSILASELLTKNKKRIVAARIARKRSKSGAVAGGGYIQKRKLTKAQIAAAEAAKKAALAAALGGGWGGKREKVRRPALGGGANVSAKKLRKTCAAKLPNLKGCAESIAGGAPFKAKLHISEMGQIHRVTCKVGGKTNSKLSACAAKAFSRVNFGPQKSASTFTCGVGAG